MADILSYFEIVGSNRSDPLMGLVYKLRNAERELNELKAKTSGFIIPKITDSNEIIPVFDENKKPELVKLTEMITNKIIEIQNITGKINRINNLLNAHAIELPLLEAIDGRIRMLKSMIKHMEDKIHAKEAAILTAKPGLKRLEFHKAELESLRSELETLKTNRQPEIDKLEKLAGEIIAVING